MTFWSVAKVCHLYTFYCWERLKGVFLCGFCVFTLFIKWWKMLNISGKKEKKKLWFTFENFEAIRNWNLRYSIIEKMGMLFYITFFMRFFVFVIQRELKSKLPYEIVNGKLLNHSNNTWLWFSNNTECRVSDKCCFCSLSKFWKGV